MPEIFRGRFPAGMTATRLKPKRPSRARGYDYRWEVLSKTWRRRHPMCRFHEQEGGRVVLADLVDHIVPVVDRPERLMDVTNLQSLCLACHGLKGWLEERARALGNVEVLTLWCEDPTTRPVRRGDL